MITLASKTKFETEIKGLKEMLDAKEASIVALTKEFEAVKAELTELKNTPPVIVEKENTEEINSLKKELGEAKLAIEEFDKKVKDAALEIVASQGVAPLPVKLEQPKTNENKNNAYGSRVVFSRE